SYILLIMTLTLSTRLYSPFTPLSPPYNLFFFFFFNDPATTEIYTLSLHDALPICDPQGVVSSELRGIHRHNIAERRLRTVTANANLWLTHLLAVLVFLAAPRAKRLFLRHEDFLADPATATRRILEMAGSSAQPPDFAPL